jgi:hypothetical protein
VPDNVIFLAQYGFAIEGKDVRDGIYKNLPLGRGWKSLLKSCEREKERGGTAGAKALRAIVAEIGVEVSGKFIHELLATARRGESLLPGFRGIDREPSAACGYVGPGYW